MTSFPFLRKMGSQPALRTTWHPESQELMLFVKKNILNLLTFLIWSRKELSEL